MKMSDSLSCHRLLLRRHRHRSFLIRLCSHVRVYGRVRVCGHDHGRNGGRGYAHVRMRVLH